MNKFRKTAATRGVYHTRGGGFCTQFFCVGTHWHLPTVYNKDQAKALRLEGHAILRLQGVNAFLIWFKDTHLRMLDEELTEKVASKLLISC